MKTFFSATSSAIGVSVANNYALTSGTAPGIVGSGAVLWTSSFFNKSYNGGEFSKLWVQIGGNTRTSDTLIRFVNNGSVGNQSITIPAGATGIFADVTNSDVVTA